VTEIRWEIRKRTKTTTCSPTSHIYVWTGIIGGPSTPAKTVVCRCGAEEARARCGVRPVAVEVKETQVE